MGYCSETKARIFNHFPNYMYFYSKGFIVPVAKVFMSVITSLVVVLVSICPNNDYHIYRMLRYPSL